MDSSVTELPNKVACSFAKLATSDEERSFTAFTKADFSEVVSSLHGLRIVCAETPAIAMHKTIINSIFIMVLNFIELTTSASYQQFSHRKPNCTSTSRQ